MADLSVALAWIAISAASVKGLSALARGAAGRDTEAELGSFAGEDALSYESVYPTDALTRAWRDRG